MKPKKLLPRLLYYFRTGYTYYLSFLVSFVGWCSVIYYLMVENIPFFKAILPHFYIFILVALLFGTPLATLIGWFHFKRLLSPFFRAELDIQAEANPYATKIMMPINLPFLRILSKLAKQHNIDTYELDKMIEETEKKFNIRRNIH